MDDEFVVDANLAAEHILKYGSLSKLQGKLRLAEVQPATDVNIAIYMKLKKAYEEVMLNHSFGVHPMTKSKDAVSVSEYIATAPHIQEGAEVTDPEEVKKLTFTDLEERRVKIPGIDFSDPEGLKDIATFLASFRSWRVIKLIMYMVKYSKMGVIGAYIKTPLTKVYDRFNIKTEPIKDNRGRWGFYLMVPRSDLFLREIFDDVIWLRYEQTTKEITLQYKNYFAHATFAAVYSTLWNSIKRGKDAKVKFCSAGETIRAKLGDYSVELVVPQVIGSENTQGHKDSYTDFIGGAIEKVNFDQSTYEDAPPLEKRDEIALNSYLNGRLVGVEDIYMQDESLVMLPDGLICPNGVSFDQDVALSIIETFPGWMNLKGENPTGYLAPDEIKRLYDATLRNKLRFMGPSVMVTNVSKCSQTISYPWDISDDFE